MVGLAVDAEPVAKIRIHCTDGSNHGAPEHGRYEPERAHATFLDQVDEHIRFADAEPGAGDALATEGRLTLDTGDLQARAFHRARLRMCGGGLHESGLSHGRLGVRTSGKCCYTG